MDINFVKMHGLGNDFIVIDAINQSVNLSSTFIKALADRHRGIGFDQCLVLEPATSTEDDFNYRIYNANGNEVGQCGNGARCIAKFIHEQKLSHKKSIWLRTKSTRLKIELLENGSVCVAFPPPTFEPTTIPFTGELTNGVYAFNVANTMYQGHLVNVGNPHLIVLAPAPTQETLTAIGAQLNNDPRLPEGINVTLLQILNPNEITLFVYERGNGITQACGSAACAATVVGIQLQKLSPKVLVRLPGGELKVSWQGNDKMIMMEGAATTVYYGTITITSN